MLVLVDREAFTVWVSLLDVSMQNYGNNSIIPTIFADKILKEYSKSFLSCEVLIVRYFVSDYD